MSADIRTAAVVIAARDGHEGPQVLVIERSGSSRFLPGYVAFPGGATDPADAEHAARWFGSGTEAPRACAIRELAEEVGLALTAEGLTRMGPELDLDARPPRIEQLSEIAHWIAPVDVPVRFDARYFAVPAASGVEPTADGHEATTAWWASPGELLTEWERGRRRLYWPTYFTMLALASCEDVAALLSLRIATREPGDDEVARLPRSTFWQDGP